MSGILAALFAGRLGTLTLDISNKVNPNIVSLLTAAGWAGTSHPVLLVNNGLVNTLDIPASMHGTDLTLINAASCRIGGVYGGAAGVNGGTALRTRAAIKIQNLGILSGGGGMGGVGGSAWVRRTDYGVSKYASGSAGAVGNGQGFNPGALTIAAAQGIGFGSLGTIAASGSWGPGSGRNAAYAEGGHSGGGGNWGQAGDYGNPGQAYGDYDTGAGYDRGAPGLAGFYVDGNSYVTWLATGTRLGRVQ